MGSGGLRGLQIRRRRGFAGMGGFDSHTLPPDCSNGLGVEAEQLSEEAAPMGVVPPVLSESGIWARTRVRNSRTSRVSPGASVVAASCQVLNGTGDGHQPQAGETDRVRRQQGQRLDGAAAAGRNGQPPQVRATLVRSENPTGQSHATPSMRRGSDPKIYREPRRRPTTRAEFGPTIGMRAFTEGAIVLGVLLGCAIRLRIYLGSPLRPSYPLLWGLAGLAQDLTLFSLAGSLALLSTHFIWQRRSWSVLTAFILLLAILHLVWSEVVVFFGHPVRARDLQVGLKPVLLLRSVRLTMLFTFAGAILISWILIRLTARRARKKGKAWVTAPRLALVAVGALAVAAIPLKVHGAETTYNPAVAIAILLRDWPESDSQGRFLVPRPVLPEVEIRDVAPRMPPRKYLDDNFPLAHEPPQRSPSAPSLPKGLRPNIVFLVMEGVRSEEIGAYGDKVPGLTPTLDELARQGVRVERAYSNGSHTPEGELALWYGLLPSPYEVLMTTRSEVPMTGLPEILRRSGWRSFFWIHNGDQNFYRREDFYLPRGFQTIDGRDFPRGEARTNWGFSDRALARRSFAALDRTPEPFAAMILTVSNHHPFQLPADARSHVPGLPPERRGFIPFGDPKQIVGRHTVPMLRTIHYTDEAIGEFFALARARPWFSRTLFVITSDHGLPVAPLEELRTQHRLFELRHRIPLIFFSPLLPGGKVLPGPASQIDVTPTLLGLLGDRSARAGIGRDLLDPDSDDPARPVFIWSREAETVTVINRSHVYHGRVPAGSSLTDSSFLQETLFDPLADPEGARNRITAEPRAAEDLRRAARVYFQIFPWLVVQGRAGVAPGLKGTSSASARR